MSHPDLVAKKSKKKFYVGIMAVVLIVIIVGAVSFYYFSSNGTPPLSSGTPTMSSMAGTYVEQTSSGTGYTIILYENGTGLFSSYSGTWSIVNSTTLEGTYRILSFPRDDYFTITNNGFTSVQTGNIYVKK
jgi:anionic cell wall polymer biosynthesis LytR-Cps2A-Psr (LCP) family protein